MKILLSGLIIVVISWFVSWTRMSFLYEHAFFPLWLGYILTVNGISNVLFKKSLLRETKFGFLILFFISIPMWWYFEFFNKYLQNWHYLLNRPISNLEFNVRASIDFSTVIPAILSTAYLFRNILNSLGVREGKKISISKYIIFLLAVLGVLFSISLFFFPKQTFPLVWISAFLTIDSINFLVGFPSVLKQLSQGIRSNIYSTAFAALFTGLWWEMWNFYSLPKWFYTIPYVGFYKVFEMPILGYLGYIPFGLEVLSFVYFCQGFFHLINKKTNLSFYPFTA